MTPAINLLRKAGIAHQVLSYEHDPGAASYGLEAVEKLDLPAHSVFKTLLAASEKNELLVAIVPVAGQLDLKALASVAGGKKATLAGVAEAERRTGYVTGGMSPFGQRTAHPVFIDESAAQHQTVFVSAGRRGLEIEIRPEDLVMLTNAQVAKIATLD